MNLRFQKDILYILLVACALCSCRKEKVYVPISLDSLSDMTIVAYRVDAEAVNRNIRRLAMADVQRTTADVHARRHYLGDGGMVWLTRCGVGDKADSVLAYVAGVDTMGFSRESFGYSAIRADLERVRTLRYDADPNARNGINHVYARLEYHLTKAFLRYAEGQRFGFVNPRDVFNRLDVRDSDSVRVSYRSLYDVPTRRPDGQFQCGAFAVMRGDAKAVGQFLAQSHPENPLYGMLCAQLSRTSGVAERRRLMCNIERARWRHGDYPQMHKKYVVVNIPSLHLMAVDGSEAMTMRIGLGSLETKTPLLTSRVKRMDFNPQWVIPKSIVKKSVVHHAGNRAYFDSHNYFVRERKTGLVVEPEHTTPDMLLSQDYMVVQRGGVGNALGRVIFRFDNDYSIFMHDTSNPGVFARSDRSVSHGCIRVERPYDLAVYMLADKDEALMERMRYSMTVDYGPHTTDDSGIDRKKMLGSLTVKPEVPLFITYYTLYPDHDGRIVAYDDIYGYDSVIYSVIKNYI